MEAGALSCSKMIKVSAGVSIFLSQLESFTHGEANFESMAPIELKHIVDIKKSNENDEEDNHQKKSKLHKGFKMEKIIH